MAEVRADAIVVAAGSSTRMGGVDKLGVRIGGRPLLAWAVDALAAAPEVERIVLVTAAAAVDRIAAEPWLSPKVVAVVAGGARRQESVHAGFAALGQCAPAAGGGGDGGDGGVSGIDGDGGGGLPDDRVVLVHDAARPAVKPSLVAAVAAAARASGAAIPVAPLADTIKRVTDGRIVGTLDRDGLGAAQTPQGVRAGLLRSAWSRHPADGPDTFTDEASLLEACRIDVHAIPGDPSNFKVTLPDDLGRAEAALLGSIAPRVGLGQDTHPFGPGEPLSLGGIRIDGAPRLHGHSDGDVALHAVADALLGAAGLGDLGGLFPADTRTPRGIDSRELLTAVVDRVVAAGYRTASVDLTIVAARPRLGDRLDAMRDEIAALVGLDRGRVNVKASTGNLHGPEGAGQAISAQAIAIVEAAA